MRHETEVGFDQLFECALVVLLHAPPELPLPFWRETRDLGDLLQVVIE